MSRLLKPFFAAVLFVTTFVSCKKDDTTPTPTTITDIVNSNANFSLLKQAITRANLGSALSTGSLTVFAPDNDAFAAAGITSAAIDQLPIADLTDILTYHVLATKVESMSVPTHDAVNTLLGKNLYASSNSNGVFVNGIKVKSADVQASNGVIHVISSVLIPPTQNIAEIATDAGLTLVLAAAAKANLAGALSAPGNYTVFAPTNEAFISAGFPDEASINNADAALLTPIVSSHVLATNVFSSDLTAGATVPTLQTGVSLVVGLTPPSVKINGSNSNPSNIVVPDGVDIIATNGVVHLIDRVLL